MVAGGAAGALRGNITFFLSPARDLFSPPGEGKPVVTASYHQLHAPLSLQHPSSLPPLLLSTLRRVTA